MTHNPQPDPHGPNLLLSYIQIHNTALERFKAVGDFVGDDTLTFVELAGGYRLKGEISCLGNIVIEVDKFIQALNDDPVNPLVQTEWYSYNVLVRNLGNIFRYDNQDEDFGFRAGHLDPHHKHLFDWKNSIELPESPKWVGAANWPKLNDVIQETSYWYWQNYSDLFDRDIYAPIGVRSGSQQLRMSRSKPPSLEL